MQVPEPFHVVHSYPRPLVYITYIIGILFERLTMETSRCWHVYGAKVSVLPCSQVQGLQRSHPFRAKRSVSTSHYLDQTAQPRSPRNSRRTPGLRKKPNSRVASSAPIVFTPIGRVDCRPYRADAWSSPSRTAASCAYGESRFSRRASKSAMASAFMPPRISARACESRCPSRSVSEPAASAAAS